MSAVRSVHAWLAAQTLFSISPNLARNIVLGSPAFIQNKPNVVTVSVTGASASAQLFNVGPCLISGSQTGVNVNPVLIQARRLLSCHASDTPSAEQCNSHAPSRPGHTVRQKPFAPDGGALARGMLGMGAQSLADPLSTARMRVEPRAVSHERWFVTWHMCMITHG